MGRAFLIIGGAALLLGIWIYSIIDAVQAEGSRVRTLPKVAWVLILFFVPLVGSALWFWLGRPRADKFGSFGPPAAKPERAPDDDPEFLKFLEAKARREREDAQRQEKKRQQEAKSPESDASSDDGSHKKPDSDEEPNSSDQ